MKEVRGKKMQVIMIAHNQLDLVKLGLEAFKLFGKVKRENIIVVDNASDDGLNEWLEMQQDLNYIVCNEGTEKQSVILNTVIREFGLNEDILVMSPDFVVLEDTLDEMIETLYSEEQVGAVSGKLLCNGMSGISDFASALSISRQLRQTREKNEEKICLPSNLVLIKKDMIGANGLFDERLALSNSTMMDFLIRGLCKGWKFYECTNAFFYFVRDTDNNLYDSETVLNERSVMKEKWNMNYFNMNPNVELVNCIKHDVDAKLDVLEIGCDCGVNLLEVKRRYPNAKLYGVEINQKAAEIASQIANVVVGNIEDKQIPFVNERFDYIMFGDVLEHLRDPAGTIRYCKELLKEDGKIIACIPNLMHYSVMRELLDGNFTYRDMGLLDRTHIHFFTYNEIIKMFEEEGYIVEQVGSIRGKQGEEDEETRKLISILLSLSTKADAFMYYAYQYLVVAKNRKKY